MCYVQALFSVFCCSTLLDTVYFVTPQSAIHSSCRVVVVFFYLTVRHIVCCVKMTRVSSYSPHLLVAYRRHLLSSTAQPPLEVVPTAGKTSPAASANAWASAVHRVVPS